MSQDVFSSMPQVEVPAHVYVPVAEVDPEMTETRFELRQLPGGEVAVPAYSSLDQLVACTGDRQPRILLPRERLLALRERLGFRRLVLDLELPDEQRHRNQEAEHGWR